MRYIAIVVTMLSVVLLGYVVETQIVDPVNQTPLVAGQTEAALPVSLPVSSYIQFTGEFAETAGPVTYYVSSCARCHGPVDYAYREIKNPRLGQPLRQTIKLMAEGPAMAPLDAAALRQQYDLHVAMLGATPYAWLAPPAGNVITGEAIPGTKIVLNAKSGAYQAQMQDYRFVIPNEPGELKVSREGKEIAIPLGQP
ncbi:MAG: hypothetical protein H7144_13445 [Burkholderiales bacterium]|nr:hypothetical protein [Phycisphaerae bacterium]